MRHRLSAIGTAAGVSAQGEQEAAAGLAHRHA
jgi:hypothetical protein